MLSAMEKSLFIASDLSQEPTRAPTSDLSDIF